MGLNSKQSNQAVVVAQPNIQANKGVMRIALFNLDGSPFVPGSGGAASWSTITGKPAFVAAGATADEVVSTLGVVKSADLATALSTKVNSSTYTAGLADKADKTETAALTTAVNTKVNSSTYNAGLATKSDKNIIDSVVTHESALNLIRASLADASVRPVHITCVTDSIGWGVGSDGLASQATPWDAAQEASYRQNSWPSQLEKLLAAQVGISPVVGWAGPVYTAATSGGGWQYATASAASVTASTTAGPFGAHSGAQRGGVAIGQTSGVPGYVEWPAAKMGAFTEVLVEYYGSDAGVASPCEPQIQVDGVTVYTPTLDVPTGMLNRVKISGLSDAPHTVRVLNPLLSGKTVYCTGIIVQRSAGVVVNRVGSPGATSSDAAAPAYTAIQQQRCIEALVKPGLTDLLILALGTNDFGGQIPLATYTSNLTALAAPVLAAGGSVLLFGGVTPRNNPTGTITEQQYDDAAQALAAATPRMAFVSLKNLLQGRAVADALGQFVNATTVHPSRRGANLYARALASLVTRPVVTIATTDGITVPASVRGVTPGTTTGTTQPISWAAVPGADRYVIEQALGSAPTTFSTIGETDGLSFTATGLTVSTKYVWRVTAKNGLGSSTPSPTTVRTTLSA